MIENLSGCEYVKCQYASRDEQGNPFCKSETEVCIYQSDYSSTLADRDKEIEGLKAQIDNDDKIKAEYRKTLDLLVPLEASMKAEISRLNALLTEARECYKEFKNIDYREDLASFQSEAWQVIKKIGEGK